MTTLLKPSGFTLGLSARRRWTAVVSYTVAIAGALIIAFPLLWIATTSIRPVEDVISIPPTVVPDEITFDAYRALWGQGDFVRFFVNSAVVSLVAATISVVVSLLAAYGFTRFRFRGAKLLMIAVLASQAMPGTSLVLPLLQIIAELALVDTKSGLIIAYIAFITPFVTWLLVGYLRSIPSELQEAARIDGCTNFEVLRKIVLPLTAPAVAAVWAFAFLVAWNEFFLAFILTSSDAVTLPVGLVTSLFDQYTTAWDQIAAGSIIFSLPAVLVLLFFQRYLISGLTAGAVKG